MEEFEIYRDNVAMLYRRFDEYKTRARMFMAPAPFEVKYDVSLRQGKKTLMSLAPVKSPIPIGALFLCWQQFPGLFTVETPSGKAMIFSFNGSPLSGSNVYSAVVLETGEIVNGKNAPRFGERCQALDAAVRQSDAFLADMCRRNGMTPEEFVPARVGEVVQLLNPNRD